MPIERLTCASLGGRRPLPVALSHRGPIPVRPVPDVSHQQFGLATHKVASPNCYPERPSGRLRPGP